VVTNALRWLAQPPAQAPRRVSINVSSQTLEDAAFAKFVDEAVRETRVAPQALIFEIDESDTLTRLDSAARFAQAVRNIGCQVLIDGFGQRSVSFLALETMRADFVKVDGCIVRALARSDVARQKLKAIVRVGEAIGIEVIGECVEESGILALLRELKAGYAQGFGIARPAPIEGFVPPPAP
jgi:EAL domain-containing protein (putative c-di-GMP-specific phosphodiesterase class I)